MRIDSHEAALEILENAFTDSRTDRARRGGQYSSDQVVIAKGVDEFMFNRNYGQNLNDPWRFSMINTYGNRSFVNGDVCDASGYVVPDDYQDALTALFEHWVS